MINQQSAVKLVLTQREQGSHFAVQGVVVQARYGA
jgi:hypothetical protein